MGILANREDPDEMPLNADISSGSTLFVTVKSSSDKKYNMFF